MKRALIPAAIAVALGALAATQLLSQGALECRVCVTFDGNRQCAQARGPSEEEARREAQQSACSLIAHGVSKAMKCPNVEPDEVRCSGKK